MSQKLDKLPDELQLATANHVKYIQSLDTRKDEYEYWLTEHLRLNGVYWGLVALHLLGHPDALPRNETIDFVLSCQHESGGFGAAPGHDAHMLYTVSAVQILAMVDAFDELETRGKGKAKVGECTSPTHVSPVLTALAHTNELRLSHRQPAKSHHRHLRRRRMGRGRHALPVRRLQRPLTSRPSPSRRRRQGRRAHRGVRQL